MAPPAYDIQRTGAETRVTIRGSLDINSAPLLGEERARLIVDDDRGPSGPGLSHRTGTARAPGVQRSRRAR